MRENEILEKIEYFKSPTMLYAPQQLIKKPDLIPRERGIYGWYFDVIPPGVPNSPDYIKVNNHQLLYIGIAGNQNNGRGDLRRRIRNNHLGKHTTGSSTLRRTLGELLTDELSLVKQPKNDRYWYGVNGEKKVCDWLIAHALITFQLDPIPRDVETQILSCWGSILPLNKQR